MASLRFRTEIDHALERIASIEKHLGIEPTEGIQPSIIKDIGRAISYLRGLGDIAIVLVEQYLDFAQELGDYFAVMDRGQIVCSSTRAEMDDAALKRALAI